MKLRRGLTSFAIFAAFVASTCALVFGRQSIIDQLTVWQYHPSAAIASLASDSGMSDHGKFLYYASQPQLDTRQNFGTFCPNSESNTAILGCYVNNRIYLFDVTNEQLQGIKPVTAAHEMLHAAYARFSATQKSRVDKMVEAEYQKVKNDDNLSVVMAAYQKTEPGEADNELHSILGTQFRDLSPELETYYQQYFSNRSKVTAEYASYQQVFDTLQKQADALQAQLADLKTQIETSSARYASDTAQLQADISAFNARASTSGGFTSQAQFNAARASLVVRTNQLTDERNYTSGLIDTYNQKVAELNQIATKNQDLVQSINSSLPSAPKL